MPLAIAPARDGHGAGKVVAAPDPGRTVHRRSTVDVAAVLLVLVSAVVLAVAAVDAARVVHVVAA